MKRRLLSTSARSRSHIHFEQLEDRSVPAALSYVNEDWNLIADTDHSGTLTVGDVVNSANDSGTLVTATYGVDAFGTVTTSSVAGAPITTPTSLPAFDTITEAVAATTAGGTVRVLEGTYNEFVTVGQSVTLLGAQAGVDARSRSVNPARETIINGVSGGGGGTFAVAADNVTIDGFTIRGDASIGVGINTGGGVEGLRALNNVIEGVPIGIAISGAGNLIQHNLIQNLRTTGSNAGTGIDGSDFDLVTDTSIDGNAIRGAFFAAVNISLGTLATPSTGITITNNQLQGLIFLVGNDGTLISGNTISTAGLPATGNLHGIQLGSDDTNINITDNTITVTAHDGWSGIRISGTGNSGVTAQYNVINTGAGDFGIRIGTGAYTGTLVASFNSITDPDDAISNEDATVLVDASANYWGTANPTAVQSRITGAGAANVDFSPLLNINESAANLSVVGFQPNLSGLIVHTLGTQVTSTGRIAEGIDLVAPGGTVAIVGGTYTEIVDTTGLTKAVKIAPRTGVVNIIGNLTLSPNVTLIADVNGTTPGTGFDQITVTGNVNLGGATLVVRSAMPLSGHPSFTIIDATGTLTGTFAGLPEGATVIATNGQRYTISYAGNDVVLTLVAPPPPPVRLFAVGADSIVDGHVKVYNADGSLRFSFFSFPGYNGGVRVATGDVNGDGVEDIVVGTAVATSHVKVFDGASLTLLASFLAFPGFTGGVTVAVGDVNNDHRGDIIVGTATGTSHVKVFDYPSGGLLESFLAFPGFGGGVTVASGNFNGTGGDDIVVGTASGASHVKVFDSNLNLLASFLADPSSTSGVNVGAGNLRNGDNFAELLVAPASGDGVVRVFAGGSAALVGAFDPGFPGRVNGIRVAAGDATGDGLADILVSAGPGQPAIVRVFNAASLTQVSSVDAFDGFLGGLFVG